MANKTAVQLTTLSGITDNDYLVVYDFSEPGEEKLKKYPHSSLKSEGLADFVLKDGTIPFTATVGGVDPESSSDLSTKNYVDSEVNTLSGSLSNSAFTGNHNDTTNKQGGTTSEYYHLTLSQHSGLTGSSDTNLHQHDSLHYSGAEKVIALAGGAKISNTSEATLYIEGNGTSDSAELQLRDSGSGNHWDIRFVGSDNSTEANDFTISFLDNVGFTYEDWLNFDFSASNISLGKSIKLPNGTSIDEFSIDGTLSGNSDTAIPTEKAVKTYVDNSSSSTINVTTTAVGITISDSNDIVEVISSGEIVLLHAASTAAKKRYDIKNTSTGTITVSGTDNIDNTNSISIPPYESRTLAPTGSKWIII